MGVNAKTRAFAREPCENACMQLNWDDMRTVLALVRGGTLAAAGDALGVTYTTVARRVTRAEKALGQPLFERHPEGYVPMPLARDLAVAAEGMEREEHQLLRRVTGKDQTLSGRLTLTAPQLLIQAQLAPVLKRFIDLYPEVELVVKASNDLLDLNRREADLAIRISSEPGETLIGRQLTAQKSACFAAPEVAEAAARSPEAPLDWVLYTHHKAPPKVAWAIHPNSRVRARFDDMVALKAAAEAGMGALRMPVFLGRTSPALVPLRHLATMTYAPIWMLTHKDLRQSRKVAALKELLVPWFRKNAAIFTEL